MRTIIATLAVVISVLAGCAGEHCDSEARTSCDHKASSCVSSKCGDKEGDEFMDCFDYLCLPALCECLEAVSCAWQEPACDDY